MVQKYQVTQPGYDKLIAEVADFEKNKRPEAVERLKKAREMGDLAENSEYASSKESLAFIDERLMVLKEQIQNSEIITNGKNQSIIEIGETVVIEENGEKSTFTIVGELEADISQNKISNTSPIGKALLGKSVGNTVEVTTPGGKITYKIVEIK